MTKNGWLVALVLLAVAQVAIAQKNEDQPGTERWRVERRRPIG